MEKRPSEDLPDYDEFYPQSRMSSLIDETGSHFCCGIVVGTCYHLIKSGKQQPLLPRFKSAFAKSPRAGGLLALCNVAVQVPGFGLGYLFGNGFTVELAAHALGGALMWAPKGIHAAAIAGVLVPSVGVAVPLFATLWIRKTRARLWNYVETQTNTYPNYRLPQHRYNGD